MAVGGKQFGLITNIKVGLAHIKITALVTIFKMVAGGNSNLNIGFNLKLARW